ncbi:MAG TPA: aminopeptidase [Ignavibacteria bacterium]|nr:aminopeptidase [Ignavibacteria bacterium]
MSPDLLKKYSEVIVKSALDIYEGQCLLIIAGVLNHDFAVMVADTAYENGAKYVDVWFSSDKIKKSRIARNKKESFLEFIPNYSVTRSNELLANDWAFLKIDNVDEIDVMKGIDTHKMEIITKNEQKAYMRQAQAITSFHMQWSIAAPPGVNWAKRVTGIDDENKAKEKLSENLIKILRLDAHDPVKEWKEHAEQLNIRAIKLASMNLDKLVFSADGTNLEIGLNSGCIWKGGLVNALNGRTFIPNLPTEEVFTTPDFRRTNGRAKVTRPVKVLETQINGIWFEFKEGKLVDYGCDNNKEILDTYFNIDEGARYLGEVALVDSRSKIFESGLIFNSILYDENAACHIALGRGFSACIENGNDLTSPEEMKKHGCNFSLVHTDFMIGTKDINVAGYDKAGNKHRILEDGRFVI